MSRKIILVLLIVAALLGLVIWYQSNGLEQQRERAASAELLNDTYRASVNSLQKQVVEQYARLTELRKIKSQLQSQSDSRLQRIRILERENEAYQNWAKQPLPVVTQRLHHRPVITGAREYQKYLSDIESLRLTGE